MDAQLIFGSPIVVVGAGPAGLAAAAACRSRGISVTVIEQGPTHHQRKINHESDIVSGTGGAGLFSDGKFSFYPSATSVWKVSPRVRLEESFNWLASVTTDYGLRLPPLPSPHAARSITTPSGGFKRYPSIYMGLDDRADLIHRLTVDTDLRNYVQVDKILPTEVGAIVKIRKGNASEVLNASAVVYAGGRFGPLYLPSIIPSINLEFRRLEIGIRIEQSAADFFLRDDAQVDSKIIIKADPRLEFRTFCCCRNGQMVTTVYDGLTSVSGHSDGPPTERSNVGFNLRVSDPQLAADLWSELLPKLRHRCLPAAETLESFLHPSGRTSDATGLHRILGDTLSFQLAEGLTRLMRHFPQRALEGARLVGPTIEGVGMYPQIRADLRTNVPDLWVAGDAGGIFRGLTAALISGYSAGLAAAISVSTRATSR
jgi:uncharacterized FAD-dependent dehydrogenase